MLRHPGDGMAVGKGEHHMNQCATKNQISFFAEHAASRDNSPGYK